MSEQLIVVTDKGREYFAARSQQALLDDHHASPPDGLVTEAHTRLRAFLDEGWQLTYKNDGFPGLLGVTERNRKLHRHLCQVHVPYRDHVRFFVNRKTRERMLTHQTYFPCFERAERWGSTEQAFHDKYKALGLWATGDCVTFENRFNHTGAVFQEALAERLRDIKQNCDDFAQQFALEAEVSFEKSWYYPGQTVWISFRAGV